MANYASVDVEVRATREAVLSMYTDMLNIFREEREEQGEEVYYNHLKYLLDKVNIPEVEGRFVDWKSHFTYTDLKDYDVLVVSLEQPWNANLERFANWVKTYDENARILYYAEETMCDYYVSNDPAFIEEHPRYGYEDIAS